MQCISAPRKKTASICHHRSIPEQSHQKLSELSSPHLPLSYTCPTTSAPISSSSQAVPGVEKFDGLLGQVAPLAGVQAEVQQLRGHLRRPGALHLERPVCEGGATPRGVEGRPKMV